jgi:hypothetical protein
MLNPGEITIYIYLLLLFKLCLAMIIAIWLLIAVTFITIVSVMYKHLTANK